MTTTELKWYPLQHFIKLSEVDELHYNKNRGGLYIWGFKDDKNLFWPYYVGKHRNVPFRLCEHLSNLKGGNYTIYNEDNLFRLKDDKYYEPYKLADRIRFIDDSYTEDQGKQVKNMIARFHFTYCLMPDFEKSGDIAEKVVLNCFSKNVLINTIFGKPKFDLVDIGNLFSDEVIRKEWDNREGKFNTAIIDDVSLYRYFQLG